VRGEGTKESGRSMEAEISQGRPKALPATQNTSQISSEGADRNKEVGGTIFKFGRLILRKIIKTVATRCHILRLKCTKFDSGWGSAPGPPGSCQRSQTPSCIQGVLLLREGEGREKRGKGEGAGGGLD